MELENPIKRAGRANTLGLPLLLSLLAICCLGLFTTPASALNPYDRWAQELNINQDQSYDGTRVMEVEGRQIEMTERRAPGKMYTEIFLSNMTTGIILREDLQKSYTLMPSLGYYRETSMEEGMTQASNGLEFSKIEKVGSENINGHASTKYQARFSDKEGEGTGFIWVTDTGVPIKMDMVYSNNETQGTHITMEFTELNLRDQDPKYFEVPANLKPMTLGGGLSGLGAMLGMGGEAAATGEAAPSEEAALATARKACLEEAARVAQEEAAQEEESAFGMVMGAVTSLSSMADSFGLTGGGDAVTAIYAPGASADDVAAAAQSMGVSQADIERCRQP